MASRNTNNNAKRAARRGKKNAVRRTKRTTAATGPNAESPRVNKHDQGRGRHHQCFTCGVKSRPSDDTWSGFMIPNMTREVRWVCPVHAPLATVESIFSDLFPNGLPAAHCQRCGKTRTPGDEGWSVLLDDDDRVVGHLCPEDQTGEEKAAFAANSATYQGMLKDAITSGQWDHELHVVSRAEFACRAVFERQVSTYLDGSLHPEKRLVTRHDLVDWAAEAVDLLSPPEDARSDFLVAFFEQYVLWVTKGLDSMR